MFQRNLRNMNTLHICSFIEMCVVGDSLLANIYWDYPYMSKQTHPLIGSRTMSYMYQSAGVMTRKW